MYLQARLDGWQYRKPSRGRPAWCGYVPGQSARPATLKLAAAVISTMHRYHDHDSPWVKGNVVDAMLKGARRKASKAGIKQRQAAPLSPADVARIEATADLPRVGSTGRTESVSAAAWRGRVDVALVRLMFDALLRRGEAAALTWADLSREADGTWRVYIAASKTDPDGEGAWCYVGEPTMQALDAIRPADVAPETRVFGLTADSIGRRIRAACRAAGLPDGYSGHSPRVGMASLLVQEGATLAAVVQAGRWRHADMAIHYTRKSGAGQGAVAALYEAGKV